jgi:hypothetical protein
VSGAPSGPKLQRLTAPFLEGNRAPDNYSGKISLPRLSSTAPSCLGTIKETPRCMEESPKHSLSILRHPDSAPAHSLCCVRDLSSIRVMNPMLSFELESSLVCVGVLRI